MSIVIIGAGAVGGTFGALLARGGEDVFFLARGAHLEEMKARGLAIRRADGGFTVPVRASDRAADAGRADVLVVCVKAYDTAAACEPCRAILAPETAVLTLQNGLGNAARLRALFPGTTVIPGVAYVGAEVEAPGVIRWDTAGRALIGASPKSAALAERFTKAGLPCAVAEDGEQAVWEKLVANAVFNVLATVEGCELGDLLKEPRRERAERAIDELAAVAAAQGIVVRLSAREQCWKFCIDHPTFRTSTQQDSGRGRPLEVEALNGELVRLGRMLGVPTPTLDGLYEALQRINARAGGRPSPS